MRYPVHPGPDRLGPTVIAVEGEAAASGDPHEAFSRELRLRIEPVRDERTAMARALVDAGGATVLMVLASSSHQRILTRFREMLSLSRN